MPDPTPPPRPPPATQSALPIDVVEVVRQPDLTSLAWHLERAAGDAESAGMELLAAQLRQLATTHGLQPTW